MVQKPAETQTHLSARISGWLGVVVVLAGLMVLVGLVFDIRHLMSVLPDLVVMKANTALGFVLGGLGLWLSGPGKDPSIPKRNPWLAMVVTLLLAALGVLTLVEYGFHLNLGIDEALFRDR